MVKFGGYDKEGKVIEIKCKEHKFSDLPMNGLTRSFDNIGLYEPVIIPISEGINLDIWMIAQARIKNRAEVLKAQINWTEIYPEILLAGCCNVKNEPKYLVWFSI